MPKSEARLLNARDEIRSMILENLMGNSGTSKQIIALVRTKHKDVSERVIRDVITLMRKNGELFVPAYVHQYVESGEYQQLVSSYTVKTRPDQYDAPRPKVGKHDRQRRYKHRKRVEERAKIKRTSFDFNPPSE